MSEARPGNAGRADYPRMLYHADGRTLTVDTPEDHDALMGSGWDTEPAAIHQRNKPTPAPTLSGGDPMAQLIRSVMNEVLDERGLGTRRRR
jgi:hypothetical protein